MPDLLPLSPFSSLATVARRLIAHPWDPAVAATTPSTLETRAHQAGVGLGDDDDASAHDGRPAMVLSEDIRKLLGIKSGHGTRRGVEDDADMYTGDDPEPEPADFSELGARLFNDGTEMLDRNTELVRGWLRTNESEAELRGRGLIAQDVETQLQYHSGRALKIIQEAAFEERAAFTLVPNADYLFAHAIRDADLAALLSPRPEPAATTTTTAATTEAATTATPATTTTSDPLVDMALRGQALGIVQKFQSTYFRLLPQVYAPANLHDLWDLISGEVEYADARLLAATFPCALSLDFSYSSPRLIAHYPKGSRKGTHVHRASLRGYETLVARDIGSYKVRISTDRQHWETLQIYTDDVVEAAKLRAWERILDAVDKIYRFGLAHTQVWQP